MKGINIIAPSAISLVTTYKCTAACADCCFQCNPRKEERLTLLQMVEFIDSAKSIYPSISLVAITGGECFTLGEDLYRLIEYIHNKNMRSRIVTNGSWAVTMEKSRDVLKRLIYVGLDEINFSTGDSHQHFVPVDRVINGIIAAQECRIMTAVNVESGLTQHYSVDDFKQEPRLLKYIKSPFLKIVAGEWIPFSKHLHKTAELSNANKVYHSNFGQRCKQLFKIMTLDPKEELLCCCGLTAHKHAYLNLGVIHGKNLKHLWESQFDDFIKIWLYAEGPLKILEFAQKIDSSITIDTSYSVHTCALCMQILSDKKIISVLKQNYTKILSRVLLEYSIQTNIKNKISYYYEKEKH